MPAEASVPSSALPLSPTARPAPVAVAPLPVPEPEPASDPAQYGPIKPGESLSKIASGLDLRRSFSLEQTMLALLQANPDAFLGDDINRLRSGTVLRVPTREDVAKISADEAAQVVRQPDAAPAANAASTASAPAVAKPAAVTPKPVSNEKKAPAVKPAAVAAAVKPVPAAAPRREEARLQIVPPAAPGKAKGNTSGTSAGGEGSMLQQELRQRDEDIAAKSAEIVELKERLVALEKLRDEQQKLLSLKDSELAAVQARLAEANRAEQVRTAAPATKASTQQAAPVEATDKPAVMPWLWGGVGVVALALLAWLVTGRRKQAPPPRRSVFDSAALAASMPAPALHDDEKAAQAVRDEVDLEETHAAEAVAPVEAALESRVEAAIDTPLAAAPAAADAPAWHAGWTAPAAPAPQQEAPAEMVAGSAVAEAQPVVGDDLSDPAAVPAQASPEQRFKLARAFLDVGDEFSAQQLLLELLDHEDEAVSGEAARMLGKLVG